MSSNKKESKIINLNKSVILSCEQVGKPFGANSLSKDGLFKDVVLIESNKISRNNCEYEDAGLSISFESEYLQEHLQNGGFVGELGHPSPDAPDYAFSNVDPNNISHRVDKPNKRGNAWIGDVQTMAPKGYILEDWAKKGFNFGISIRCLTPTYTKKTLENGKHYVLKHGEMMIIAFDAVQIPGFKNARMVNPSSYNATMNSSESLKLDKVDYTMNDWSVEKKFNLSDSDINLMLRTQEGFDRLEQLYKFNLKNSNIVFSKESMFVKVMEKVNGQDKERVIKFGIDTGLLLSVMGSRKR